MLSGSLTRAPRGANGFGYDPIFVPDGMETTTAELAPQDKDAISHRGRAFRAIASHRWVVRRGRKQRTEE